MALKSLPEIAFDAYQTFAHQDMQLVNSRGNKAQFSDLEDDEKLVFERIASRVEAEIKLRQEDKVKQN